MASFVAALFFIQAVAPSSSWAISAGIQPQGLPQSVLTQLEIPAEFGTVEKVVLPTPTEGEKAVPPVIFIQDAHANPEAQRNIAHILEVLHREKRISGIGLEGAFGQVRPSLLQLFDDPKTNQAMVDYLANLGELTGAELFGYQHELPIQGIDDPTVYEKSFQNFVQIKKNTQVQPFLGELLKKQQEAERRYFSAELRDFAAARRQWNSNGADAAGYFEKFRTLTLKQLGLDLSAAIHQFEQPNLVRIVKASEIEKKFNVEKTRMEISVLRKVLRKNLKPGPERVFFMSSLEHLQKDPLGRHFFDTVEIPLERPVFSTRHFYERLYEVMKQHQLTLLNYPALLDAAGLAIMLSEVDAAGLMKELRPLEKKLERKLARTSDARKTLLLDKKRVLIEKLLTLSLTSFEYGQIASSEENISVEKIVRAYDALMKQNPVQLKVPQKAFKRARMFYEEALERDHLLGKNAAALSAKFSNNSNGQAVALVAGGFHQEGLLHFFEMNRIPYALITPRAGLTKDENLYEKVMLGKNAGAIAGPKTDTLNPRVLLDVQRPSASRRPGVILRAMSKAAVGDSRRFEFEIARKRAEAAGLLETEAEISPTLGVGSASVVLATGRSEVRSGSPDATPEESIAALKKDFRARWGVLKAPSAAGVPAVSDSEKIAAYQQLIQDVMLDLFELTVELYPQAAEQMAVLVSEQKALLSYAEARLVVETGIAIPESVFFYQKAAQTIFGAEWKILPDNSYVPLVPFQVRGEGSETAAKFPKTFLAVGSQRIAAKSQQHYRALVAVTREMGMLKEDYEQKRAALWTDVSLGQAVDNKPGEIYSTMARQSQLADEVLKRIYELAQHLYPEQAEKIALIVYGSQGRWEMQQNSDSEGRVVMADLKDAPDVAGFIGNATQVIFGNAWLPLLTHEPVPMTASTQASLHHQQLKVTQATELLDARYLVGNFALAEEKMQLHQTQVREHKVELVTALLRILEGRYQKGNLMEGLYEREPDVKDSLGGMRTLHYARWIAQAFTGEADGSEALGSLRAQDLVTSAELDRAYRAYTFLNQVRAALVKSQLPRSKEPRNKLKVAGQAKTASILGYLDSASAGTAVDQLLNDYYAASSVIFHFTYRILRRISETKDINPLHEVEVEMEDDLKQRLSGWGVREVQRSGHIFHLDRGFVDVPADAAERTLVPLPQADEAADKPSALVGSMMSIFVYAAEHGLRLSGDLLDQMEEAMPDFKQQFSEDESFKKEALESFADFLRQKNRVAYVLERMHYLGLLDVLLPGFGSITYRTRFGLDDRVTQDRQVIDSIAALERFVFEGMPPLTSARVQPMAKNFFSSIYNEEYLSSIRYALLLRAFSGAELKKLGQHFGSQVEKPGVSKMLSEANWFRKHQDDFLELIRRDAFWHGNTLPDFAQAQIKRDPSRWYLFIAASLAKLYAQRPDHFWLYPEAIQPAFTALQWVLGDRDVFVQWLDEQEDHRFKSVGDDTFWEEFGETSTTYIEIEPLQNHLGRARDNAARVTVYNRQSVDEPGRLEKIAGALGANGLGIESVAIGTTQEGYIVDSFIVTDNLSRFEAQALPKLRQTLGFDLHQALDRGVPIRTLFLRKKIADKYQSQKRTAQQQTETRILFNGDIQHLSVPTTPETSLKDRTIVRVETENRSLLLLHMLTKLIAAHGMNILEGSTIDTEGHKRAVNTFVLSYQGKALTPTQQTALTADLEFWLEQDVIDLNQLSRHKDLVRFKTWLENYLEHMRLGTAPLIVYVGDIHGDLRQFQRIRARAEALGADQIIFAGDFLDRGMHGLAVIEELKQMYEQSDSHKTDQIVLVAGNHEMMFMEAVLGSASVVSGMRRDLRTDIFDLWLRSGGWAVLREEFGNTIQGIDISEENTPLIQFGSPEFLKIVAIVMGNVRLQSLAGWLQKQTKLYYDDRNLGRTVHAGFRLDADGKINMGFEGEDTLAGFSMMREDMKRGGDPRNALRAKLLDERNAAAALLLAPRDWAEAIKPRAGDDRALKDFLLEQMVGRVFFGHTEPLESALENVVFSQAYAGRINPLDGAMGRQGKNFGIFTLSGPQGLQTFLLPPADQEPPPEQFAAEQPVYQFGKDDVIAQFEDLLSAVMIAIAKNRQAIRSEVRSVTVDEGSSSKKSEGLQAAKEWLTRWVLSVAQPRKYLAGSWQHAWAVRVSQWLSVPAPADSNAGPALYVEGFDTPENLMRSWAPWLGGLTEGQLEIHSESTDDMLRIQVSPWVSFDEEMEEDAQLRFVISRGRGTDADTIRNISLLNVPDGLKAEEVFAGLLGWLQQRGFKMAILDELSVGGVGSSFARQVMTDYFSDKKPSQSWIQSGLVHYVLGDFSSQHSGLVGPTVVPTQAERESAARRSSRFVVTEESALVEPSTSWSYRAADGVYGARVINENGEFQLFIYPGRGSEARVVVTRVTQNRQETFQFERQQIEFSSTGLDADGLATEAHKFSLTEAQAGPEGYRSLPDIYANVAPQLDDFTRALQQAVQALGSARLQPVPPAAIQSRLEQLANLLEQKLAISYQEVPSLTFAELTRLRREFELQGVSLVTPNLNDDKSPQEIRVTGSSLEAVTASMRAIVDRYHWRDHSKSQPIVSTLMDGQAKATQHYTLLLAPSRSEVRQPMPLNLLDLKPEEELLFLQQAVLPELLRQRDSGTGQLPVSATFSDPHGGLERLDPALVDSIVRDLPDLTDARKVEIQKAVIAALRAKRLMTLQEAFDPYGIDLKKALPGRLFFQNLGDLVDRGSASIQTVLRAAELYDAGLSSFITGNHDQYALMALLGFNLPWYEGFEFYGYQDDYGSVTEAVEAFRIEHPQLANSKSWWSHRLKDFVAHQQKEQKTKWNDLYEEVRGKDGKGGLFALVKPGLTPEQQRVWNFFSGWYLVDISTGTKAVSSMSVNWWKDLLNGVHDSTNPKENFKGFIELYQEIREEKGFEASAAVNRSWRRAIRMIESEILPGLKEDFEKQVDEKGLWWRVFDAINYKNYISAEWYAQDWPTHGDKKKGWGPRVIEEQNVLNQALLGKTTHVSLATFLEEGPETALLRQVRAFFERSFNLALRDLYQNTSMHSFLPVEKEGPYRGWFYFDYKGQRYRGKGDGEFPSIWEGLRRISTETRKIFEQINDDPKQAGILLKQLQEPFRVVTSWYADVTTESKPKDIAWALNEFGPEQFAEMNGVIRLTTGHVPIKSFAELSDEDRQWVNGFLAAGIFAFSDRSWAEVYGRWGGMLLAGLEKGFRLRGFPSSLSEEIVDDPDTILVTEGADKDAPFFIKLFENPGIEPEHFVDRVIENVQARIKQLQKELLPTTRSEVRYAAPAALQKLLKEQHRDLGAFLVGAQILAQNMVDAPLAAQFPTFFKTRFGWQSAEQTLSESPQLQALRHVVTDSARISETPKTVVLASINGQVPVVDLQAMQLGIGSRVVILDSEEGDRAVVWNAYQKQLQALPKVVAVETGTFKGAMPGFQIVQAQLVGKGPKPREAASSSSRAILVFPYVSETLLEDYEAIPLEEGLVVRSPSLARKNATLRFAFSYLLGRGLLPAQLLKETPSDIFQVRVQQKSLSSAYVPLGSEGRFAHWAVAFAAHELLAAAA